MGDELQQYIAIGLLILTALMLGGVMLLLPTLLGKKRSHGAIKDSPYECGMPAAADPHPRLTVKFYLVAMLFLLLDIEVVFFLGWAAVFRELLNEVGIRVLLGAIVFLLILEVGHIYVWKKGALDWTPPRSQPRPEKEQP
jgi:NADH-quinone oxidoreductase subunit A